MKRQETQQFARFFIKDVKVKKSKYTVDKVLLDDFALERLVDL